MKLKDFLLVNSGCDVLSIRESDGIITSAVIFTYSLTSGPVPEELLGRKIKHIQSGPMEQYGRPGSIQHITLYK